MFNRRVFCYSASVGIRWKGRGWQVTFAPPRVCYAHLGWAVPVFQALRRAGPLVTLEDLGGRARTSRRPPHCGCCAMEEACLEGALDWRERTADVETSKGTGCRNVRRERQPEARLSPGRRSHPAPSALRGRRRARSGSGQGPRVVSAGARGREPAGSAPWRERRPGGAGPRP